MRGGFAVVRKTPKASFVQCGTAGPARSSNVSRPDDICSRAAGPLTCRSSPFAFEALAVARASLFAGSWDFPSPTLIAGDLRFRSQSERGAFLPHHETEKPFRTTTRGSLSFERPRFAQPFERQRALLSRERAILQKPRQLLDETNRLPQRFDALAPPSIGIATPLTKLDRGEDRNATTSPSSIGSPIRPTGISAPRASKPAS